MGLATGMTDTVPPTNDSVAAQRAAFADVFNANYSVVLHFITRRVAEPIAEDLTAEVFTRAWESWPKAPAKQRPWLPGIAPFGLGARLVEGVGWFAFEDVAQHYCVVYLGIVGGVDERHQRVFGNQFLEFGQRWVSRQFRSVGLCKLRKASRVVIPTFPQFGTRRHVLQPQIEIGAFLRHTSRPEPINQHSIAVGRRCRVVCTLDLNSSGHASRLRHCAGGLQPAG